MARVNARAQVAARRLMLDARGALNPDGRVLAAAVRRMCGAQSPRIAVMGERGMDPYATVASAAKREVWEGLKILLLLDEYEITNLSSEDREQ